LTELLATALCALVIVGAVLLFTDHDGDAWLFVGLSVGGLVVQDLARVVWRRRRSSPRVRREG